MDEKQLKQIIEETASETATRTRDQFAVLAERLEAKIELVAESVAGNAERFERQQSEMHRELEAKIELVADAVAGNAERFERLESEMHREFDEVRSMIRLSYTELDRRLRSLEETVGQLQSRMDRLESRSPQ